MGGTYGTFTTNEPLRAATERHLLVIAEAAKHIPDAEKAAASQIEWRAVIGLGNILRHGYDIIDDRRIWDVVQLDLPTLKTAIEAMRRKY